MSEEKKHTIEIQLFTNVKKKENHDYVAHPEGATWHKSGIEMSLNTTLYTSVQSYRNPFFQNCSRGLFALVVHDVAAAGGCDGRKI